jgi:hypothetical protein
MRYVHYDSFAKALRFSFWFFLSALASWREIFPPLLRNPQYFQQFSFWLARSLGQYSGRNVGGASLCPAADAWGCVSYRFAPKISLKTGSQGEAFPSLLQ